MHFYPKGVTSFCVCDLPNIYHILIKVCSMAVGACKHGQACEPCIMFNDSDSKLYMKFDFLKEIIKNI